MFEGDLQSVAYVIGGLITVMNMGIAAWKKNADKDKWKATYRKWVEYIRLGVGTAVTVFAADIFMGIDNTTIALITPSVVGGSLVGALAGKKIKKKLEKEK